LEWFEAGKSKLTHYTVVPTQPWKNDKNELRGVWEAGYREAVAAGAVPINEVLDGIQAGYLKTSLLDAFPAEAATAAGERRALSTGLRFHSAHALKKLGRVARKAAKNPVGILRRVFTGHW
jgi:hypothetical protein